VVTVERIALGCYASRDRQNVEDGAYFVEPEDEPYAEAREDAASEYQYAKRTGLQEETRSSTIAVKLLIEHGMLPVNSSDDLQSGVDLKCGNGSKSINLLCRLIERADLTLAEKCANAVFNDSLASPTDSYFECVARPPSETEAKPKYVHTVAELIALYLKQES
jgi:hypothetical protein